MSTHAPPLRSPARDLDAQVGRALGLDLRETLAAPSPMSALPASTRVVIYEHQDAEGRWRRLPHYSTDAGTIPTLLDELRDRLGRFQILVEPDAIHIWNGAAREDRPPAEARLLLGRAETLSGALCRAIVTLAAAET